MTGESKGVGHCSHSEFLEELFTALSKAEKSVAIIKKENLPNDAGQAFRALEESIQRMTGVREQLNTVRAQEDECRDREIISTIEFYFGDSNLGKDRFLRRKIEDSEDGWIPLDLLTSTFNKLKSLSQDSHHVSKLLDRHLQDLRTAKTNVLGLELSDDKLSIRRTKDLPPEDWSLHTSLFVQGIDRDADWDSLQKAFCKYGKVVYIGIPKDTQTGDNKGFAFVEFSDPREARRAVDRWDSQATGMYVMSKLAWVAAKKKRGKGSYQDRTVHGYAQSRPSSSSLQYTPGVIVRVSDIENAGHISRNVMRSIFEEYGDVQYVDFTIGQTDAHIRYKNALDAKSCIEGIAEKKKTTGNADSHNHSFTVSILEGNEDKKYWETLLRVKKEMSSAAVEGTQDTPSESGVTENSPQKEAVENAESMDSTPPDATEQEKSRIKSDLSTRKRKHNKPGKKRTHIIFDEGEDGTGVSGESGERSGSPPSKKRKQ